MQIVAAQLDSAWEDKAANHQRVLDLLDSADVPANSLIVLPEMFDTGFSMNVDVTVQGDDRESESFLKSVASRYNAAVLAGVVTPTSNGAANQAVAFAPDGTELVRYRKMQPFTPSGENTHYGSGDGHRIFEWQGVRIAPFVCYDLRFPEIFRPAALNGAELIIAIACWPEKRSEHWFRLLQARAIENQAFAVGVNRCGSDPKFSYDGRSCAWDPMGQLIFEATREQQALKCEVDADSVKKWRAEFPALSDCRMHVTESR